MGDYADVNGVHLYYEVHGQGRPTILLHGGLGATGTAGPNLPALAKGRKVIAVDLQGHGRTADVDRPISAENMAGDIVALIEHLKLGKADLVGYSLGGGVAMWSTLKRPTWSAGSWPSRPPSGAAPSILRCLRSKRRSGPRRPRL